VCAGTPVHYEQTVREQYAGEYVRVHWYTMSKQSGRMRMRRVPTFSILATAPPLRRYTCVQGLTLVHFSAQRKRFLWATCVHFSARREHFLELCWETLMTKCLRWSSEVDSCCGFSDQDRLRLS
jgi:hypothetical protein